MEQNTEMDALREEINNLDQELLELLEERFLLCEQIGEIKKENNLPIEDKKREAQIIQTKVNSTSLDREFVKNLYALILAESKRIQQGLKTNSKLKKEEIEELQIQDEEQEQDD